MTTTTQTAPAATPPATSAAPAEPAAQTVAEMTVADLRKLIWETVAEAINDLVGDPDEGLELSEWAAARLAQANADHAAATVIDSR